ncbi:MAG: nitroreductase family deazaflavin-dependent oxidoreductase [Anaerolineae bacterium]|nr:nitroreductase family deazaflavin-dependent oxidoreductase [Anaerolineae bacterium]
MGALLVKPSASAIKQLGVRGIRQRERGRNSRRSPQGEQLQYNEVSIFTATSGKTRMAQQSTIIPYPRGLLKWLLFLPIVFYRIGLGWLLAPTPLLVLTTKGRKSGLPRHVVLECRQHGSKMYAVSGWGNRPHWVKNLQADPIVTIQYRGATHCARAHMVENSAEAMRALYMFQRTSRFYERLFASMSSADSLDLRKLIDVAGEFTVVRFEILDDVPCFAGVQPTHRPIGFAVLGAVALFAAVSLLRRRPRMLPSANEDNHEVHGVDGSPD